MTYTSKLLQRSALAFVVVVLAVGCSSDDSDQPDARAATTEVAPTPDNLKLAVFERSYSECASTDFERLAAKYKVADKTEPGVATAVARGWAEFMRAGPDAIADGRSGCLQGFDDR